MAGAISLNITGAKALGFPYIEVGCIDGIYPIVAAKHTTPVFHPFSAHNIEQQLTPTIEHVSAAAFGSGVTQMYEKEACLDLMIQNCHAPLILDAEGIRMLRYNTWKLRFAKSPIILTPHIGEFADLFHLEKEEVMRNPLHYALKYAKHYDTKIQTGYILSVAYGDYFNMPDIDFFSMNASFLSKRTVDAIHQSGKQVFAWTVNNQASIKNLTNKGVDNIITDNPVLARETVYSRDTSETLINMIKYVFNG